MLQHLYDGIIQLLTFCHLATPDMIGIGNLDEVGVLQVRLRVALFKEELLPLTYHPQEVIVQKDDLHIHTILHDGSKLLDGHLQTTVAYKDTNSSLGCSILGTDACGQAEAHRPQTS